MPKLLTNKNEQVVALRGTLTLAQAAALAGVVVSTWWSWENGKTPMPGWAAEAFRKDAAVVHGDAYRADLVDVPKPVSRAGLIWLAAEVEQLKERYAAGLAVDAIAAAHGRTLYAIVSKLEHMGLIVRFGRNYHAVAADPWLTDSQLSYLISEQKK